MAEPRDRLARAEDIAVAFERKRRLIRQNRIHADVVERSESRSVLESPAWRRETAATLRIGRNVVVGRRSFGTPGSRGAVYGSVGRENVGVGSSGGRQMGSRSVLPSWYPRTPLRDITHVVRALERRAYLRDKEVDEAKSPFPTKSILDEPSSSSTALLEQDPSLVTPMPLLGNRTKTYTSVKLPKILLNIRNQNSDESEQLTPQKKLLNSIDTVEKVVMEELQRQRRTPIGRKAERDMKVRTLLSMR